MPELPESCQTAEASLQHHEIHSAHVARSSCVRRMHTGFELHIVPAGQVSEEKVWYYVDPSGKLQGPFPAWNICGVVRPLAVPPVTLV